MKLAIVGVTGLVGQEILEVLAERKVPITTLLPVASPESVGQTFSWKGKSQKIMSIEAALTAQPTIAIFSAGSKIATTWAPRFAAAGTTVIDNSTAWRMHPGYKLVIPEVNGHLLVGNEKIIANPNCSTIQLVMALAPLHQHYGLRRIIISTYQAVTGSGKEAVAQLTAERKGRLNAPRAYPHPIDLNIIPHIDDFLENGYTKEEMKLVHETQKILDDPLLQVTATAVRVPVLGGHSLSINAALEKDFDLGEVTQLLSNAPGIVLQDNVIEQHYPMPLYARYSNNVFVGRIRRDYSHPSALNLWVVADNLRKGAATNAVQIAERFL